MVGMVEGVMDLLEELNASCGKENHLLTDTSPTQLQNLKKSRYGLQTFPWRIASSADALNDLISALSRYNRSFTSHVVTS